MSNKKVWFITGAGRGMGADFAKAALASGHAVVATGRNTDAVSKALGTSNDLLPVKLDVTNRADAEAAVRAAVDRFGRIDVLVNNAASFYAGYFEELTPEQFDRQLSVSLIGPMNVTRAVLPVMRKQRAGHIISISSSAGLAAGFDFVTAYAASKFVCQPKVIVDFTGSLRRSESWQAAGGGDARQSAEQGSCHGSVPAKVARGHRRQSGSRCTAEFV